jgi:O-acetylhomoserine (thiol)-lyase
LFLQGIETLPLRMERHNENALAIARWLRDHDGVAWVAYPGLEDDRYHEVAGRVLRGGGGALVTFGVQGGREAGRAFIEALGLFSHLANIGDAKSLAIHNATTTHSQLSADELQAAGVTDDTVRLSIGIEHVDDLIADLDQALTKARAAAPVA